MEKSNLDVSKFFKSLDPEYDPMVHFYMVGDLFPFLYTNLELADSLEVGTLEIPLSVYELLEVKDGLG